MAIPTATEARAAINAFDIRETAIARYVEAKLRKAMTDGITSVTISSTDYPEPIPTEHLMLGIQLLRTPEDEGGYGYSVVQNDDGSVTIIIP